MLELATVLARVLEFLTLSAPAAFLSGPPLHLTRVAETAAFVLTRCGGATLPGAALADMLRRRFPGSERIARGPLMAAIIGALGLACTSRRT